MYNNSQHYPNTGYQSAYPTYQQQTYSNDYQGYQGYGGQYQVSQTNQPTPPGESFPQSNWTTTTSYATTQKDAVAQEMQQQKAQLVKQREDYVRKVSVLRHELDQLRAQKQDLINAGKHDRDLGNILRENDKLQDEIQGKMKAIHNVIEMLSSIIKDGCSVSELEAAMLADDRSKSSESPAQAGGAQVWGQDRAEVAGEGEKYCYVHYDAGLHWCRLCDEFPETAKDFLLHLQEKRHKESVKENEVDSTPWHKLPAEPMLPSDENAPKKRIPIKGLQFFVSAPSWYCKLCDVWIGDLHCASHHLKSKCHFQNYENFVSQNPHWEMEWLKDREKAMSRNGPNDSSDDSNDEKKKKKRKDKRAEQASGKDKKRKKHSKKRKKQSSDSSSSSSSSSSSDDEGGDDRSRSIRVAMRNVKQVQSIMDEDLTSKWSVLEKLLEEHKKQEEKKVVAEQQQQQQADPLINQWMSVSQPQDKDKRLLENLKDRMKHKQDAEKARQAEQDRKKREKEREERELQERQDREDRERAEEEERRRKKREHEELERIRDKDRNQVRFRTGNYRKKSSRSDEEDNAGNNGKHYRDRERESSRYRRDSDSKSERNHRKPSRSRSRSVESKDDDGSYKKKPPGPPSYKKLPFIGRMPHAFKNKKTDEKEEKREIKKESYETPRRTRFQPGTLARAFIPKPDVVCFPKLSSIPPLTIPPPPTVVEKVLAPEPPKISPEESPEAPPPPHINDEVANEAMSEEEMLYGTSNDEAQQAMANQYYQDYSSMMYSHQPVYEYSAEEYASMEPKVPLSHTMPLQPPPLPPEDDLALLGICADDMAAQSF